jgi:archaellum component FlaG (FlaF/FlaG flagellin family)
MAGIVPSLFGPTPEELMTLRRQEQAKTISSFAPAGGRAVIGAAVGTALAGGINKLFGLEDPAVKQATDVYATIQKVQQELGTDVKDPTILYPALAKGFSDAGLPEMANKVMMEGYDKMGDYQKQQAEINKLNEQAKAEVIKANKEKKSPLQIKEEYLAEVTKDFDADPTNTLLKDKKDRALQEVNNEIATKLSSDAQFSQAVAILNNPNSTPQDKARAKQVYGMLLPKVTNQGSYSTEIDDKGNTVVKPLPGSIEYEKRKNALDKGINLISSRKSSLTETTGVIDKAIEQAGAKGATGIVGKATGWIPGSPGFILTEDAIKTLKARIGFDELNKMRQESPTGGALGQVAVRELDFLQASLASLEPGLGGPRLAENLRAVKKHYEGFLNALDDELKVAQNKQANLTPAPRESLATPPKESAPAQTGESDYLSIIRGAKKNKEAR